LVDQAKLKELLGVFKKVPHLSIPDAMKLAKYSNNEISNLTFCRFLQCALPGGSINAFRALLASEAVPPYCSERCQQRAINSSSAKSVLVGEKLVATYSIST
jgi:hypothetical protein